MPAVEQTFHARRDRIAAYRARFGGVRPEAAAPPHSVPASSGAEHAAAGPAATEAALASAASGLLEASHRLRTPVNAIAGFAAMLREPERYGVDDARVREYGAIIQQSADALMREYAVLFQTAQFDAGGAYAAPAAFDLAASVRNRIEQARSGFLAADVALDDRTAEPGIPAFADRDHAHLCLDLLLHAALSRSAAGGAVLVRAETGQGRAMVSLRDYGPALREDEIDAAARVLADATLGPARMLRGSGGGTAGALALVRRLAELQGGQLETRSREARGLISRLVLPAADEHKDHNA